ncbi:MAG: hypothetical protein ABIS47_05165 [Acidimicrobiales bacterium]
MRTHPATLISHGAWSAEVDVELAPLVLQIWKAGIPTIHSCQDVGENIATLTHRLPHLADVARRERGRASLGFADVDGLLSFHDLLANAGLRDDFYERLLHWASPAAWQCTIGLRDLGLEEDEVPRAPDGTPSSRLAAVSFQVRLPRADIAEATARLERHHRGEEAAGGRPTWAAITVEGDEPRRGASRP